MSGILCKLKKVEQLSKAMLLLMIILFYSV